MAAISAHRIATATLSGTTADTVTITGAFARFELVNHAGAGGTVLTVTSAVSAAPPVAVAGAEEAEVVLCGERLAVEVERPTTRASGDAEPDVRFSIVGDGNTYSVIGIP